MPAAVLLFAGFVALGSWQVQRRAWKLDLIERVEARVHAPAVPAPEPARWNAVDAAHDEYRRVVVDGRYLDAATVFVQAVTALGPGDWVLTPLQRPDGSIVLINRGYVPAQARGHLVRGGGPVTVTGLLRLTEPGGGFLRHNDPAGDHWYSRDVAAIAAAHDLKTVAPYFVDAQTTIGPAPDAGGSVASVTSATSLASATSATSLTSVKSAASATSAPNAPSAARDAAPMTPASASSAPGIAPVAGLTVIAFHNSHLVYAITWYTLALMVAGAAWRLRHTIGEGTGGDPE